MIGLTLTHVLYDGLRGVGFFAAVYIGCLLARPRLLLSSFQLVIAVLVAFAAGALGGFLGGQYFPKWRVLCSGSMVFISLYLLHLVGFFQVEQ